MKLDRRQTHRPTQKESRTLPCLNGVWRKKKKRFQTAMSAGAHPAEENQDNFAFYRKKKFQILEWWLIIGKFLLRKSLLEAEPFSVRGECIITLLSPSVADRFTVWKSSTLSPLYHFQSPVPKGHGMQNANSFPMKAMTYNICVLKSPSISMRSTLGFPMVWQESSPP